MKRRTNAELISLLNKVTSERDEHSRDLHSTKLMCDSLRSQLVWHKQLNQQMMEAILAGAKEGSWPRKQS